MEWDSSHITKSVNLNSPSSCIDKQVIRKIIFNNNRIKKITIKHVHDDYTLFISYIKL